MELTIILYLIKLILLTPKQIHLIRMDLEEEVCGFEPKCGGNQTNLERRDTSCCLYCGCTDICFERNTCCSDKPGLAKASLKHRQQCLPALYTPKGITGDVLSDSYYTRVRCPDTYENNYIKNKCETTVPTSFEEIRFVSSDDGKIVYKNKFCALCHGENSTITWEMKIPGNYKCTNMYSLPNENIEEMTKYIISNCMVLFKRPRNIEVRSVLCFDKTKVIGRCNVTRKWDVYDKDLENLCLNETTAINVDRPLDFTYSSPYCFLCNRRNRPTTCSNSFDDRSEYRALIELINDDIWTSKTDILTGPCKSAEILDTFYGRCRHLICPKYTIPVHGKCITFIDFGQCLELLIRLFFESYVDQFEDFISKVDSRLYKIKNKLGLDKCKCTSIVIYSVTGRNQTKENEIYIRLCVKETTKCSNEYLWAKIIEIKTKADFVLSLNINGNRDQFQMTVLKDAIIDFNYDEVYTTSPSAYRDSGLEHQLICPKVELTEAEYKTIINTHDNADKLIFTSNEVQNNETIFVCCNNYIITSQSKGHKTGTPGITVVIAVILSMCSRLL